MTHLFCPGAYCTHSLVVPDNGRFGFDPTAHFVVPDDVAELCSSRVDVGKQNEKAYDTVMASYEVCVWVFGCYMVQRGYVAR